MPQTHSKPKKKLTASAASSDVLTLAEAAAYLRITEADIVRLIQQQDLPGRLINAEWRFLRSALQDWLRSWPAPGSKEAVLSVAGAWKGDPHVEEELREIYKHRGRSVTENGQ